MGAKNMNKWLSAWVKKHYTDFKGDLFSCFMVRNSGMGSDHAQIGFMTPYVWMFIGTYEKLRRFVIEQNTITSLIQLEYSGFAGATVPICTFTLQKGKVEGYKGGYIRLSDFLGTDQQAPRALEALANPDCGWFYKQSCSSFEAIPGSPIAYWISLSTLSAFTKYKPMRHYARTSKGLITGDNDEFFRLWWEISHSKIGFEIASNEQSIESGLEWFPLNKGGKFRKWYGNNEFVIHWANDGQAVHKHAKETGHHSQDYDSKLKFKDNISWSDISSGLANFRYRHNELSDHKGMPLLPITIPLKYCLGFLNSSTCAHFLSFLSPTLSCNIGEVEKLPVNVANEATEKRIEEIVSSQIADANEDWNSFEESWNFAKHPLI